MADYIPLTFIQKTFPMEVCHGLVSLMQKSGRYKIEFEGRENLRALTDGGVQICNHQNLTDIPLEMLAIRRELGFNTYPYHIIKEELNKHRIAEFLGCLPIKRSRDYREELKEARSLGLSVREVREKRLLEKEEGGEKNSASFIYSRAIPKILSKRGIITIFPQETRKPLNSMFQVKTHQLIYLYDCDLKDRPIVPTHIKYFSEPSLKSIEARLTIGKPISRRGSLQEFTQRVNMWFQSVDDSF